MNDVLKIIEQHRRQGDRSATVAVVARELGVQPETVHAWRKRGLVAIATGREVIVEWSALAQWFEGMRDKPKQKKIDNRAAKRFLRSRGMECPN